MHTSNFGDWIVHHNGGYDGDAIFVKHKKDRDPMKDFDPEIEVKIPMSVIFGLVANAVTSERISELEQMPPHKVLGIPKRLTED